MEHQQSGNQQTPESNNLANEIATHPQYPKARVTMRLSHWGDHVSVACEISLECVQMQDRMERAGAHALNTAARFVNEATSRFDRSMPLLPTG